MNGVILRRDHNEAGPWNIEGYHEPIWMGETVIRDAAGRPHKRAWRRFARVVCNNPGCSFEALVNAEVVAAQVTAVGALEGQT